MQIKKAVTKSLTARGRGRAGQAVGIAAAAPSDVKGQPLAGQAFDLRLKTLAYA